MRKVFKTIARRAVPRHGATLLSDGLQSLTPLLDFGPNPGALRAHIYVPRTGPKTKALVVVLHGCTQTAQGYDLGAGWSELADRYGFVLLFPEQQRQNNANLCFNWFVPDDCRRDQGEAGSIRNMIATVVAQRAIDPQRIFVTGLSAGGAMTSVMLALYPEIFAGGAIIAGLPYGCAQSVPEAFERMRGQGLPAGDRLADLVRDTTNHDGPWPRVSIWHGSADTTVSPSNADALVALWRSLHALDDQPSRLETTDDYRRWVWQDKAGRDVIQAFSVTGMGHGTPLRIGEDDGCGRAGPFFLEANISSTHHICQFWGLAETGTRSASLEAVASGPMRAQRTKPQAAWTQPTHTRSTAAGPVKVIEDALRSAGLMR